MLNSFDVQGRPTKSNQPHRVMKDKVGIVIESQDSTKQQKAMLQPISTRDVSNSFHLQGLIGAMNSLPKISDKNNAIGSTNEKDQLESMKRKIQDLEKENYRLCHHVKQAEQSIRNYRGALSSNNLLDNDSTVKSVSEKQGNSGRASSETSLVEIAALNSRISDLLSQNKLLESASKELQESLVLKNLELSNSVQKLQQVITSQQSEIQHHLTTITGQQTSIQLLEQTALANTSKMEVMLAAQRAQKAIITIDKKPPQSTTRPKSTDPTSVLRSLSALRSSLSEVKSSAQSSLATFSDNLNKDFAQLVSHIAQTIKAESRPLEDRISQLVKEKHAHEVQMNKMNQELVAARNEMTTLVRLHQKQLQLTDSHQVVSPIKLSPTANTTPNGKIGHVITGSALKHSSRSSPVPTLHTALSPGKLTASTEQVKHIETLLHQLTCASAELVNLQLVHSAEIKAVQHVSHVRELQRVAKEREAALEKDRLAIEAKHLKEVQSILIFSINTAEQSLSESQPHVVAKLVEGRKKRLKLLEHTIGGRMREIDQRSSETCAVNSAHLEGFQKKAQENSRVAELMTRAAAAKLADMLRVETRTDVV